MLIGVSKGKVSIYIQCYQHVSGYAASSRNMESASLRTIECASWSAQLTRSNAFVEAQQHHIRQKESLVNHERTSRIRALPVFHSPVFPRIEH